MEGVHTFPAVRHSDRRYILRVTREDSPHHGKYYWRRLGRNVQFTEHYLAAERFYTRREAQDLARMRMLRPYRLRPRCVVVPLQDAFSIFEGHWIPEGGGYGTDAAHPRRGG